MAEGRAIVGRWLRAGRAGPYVLQAAIAALHSVATSPADTDWGRIVGLYDRLVAVAPSPVAALNRAIALGERDGPAAALSELDALAEALGGYHLLHARRDAAANANAVLFGRCQRKR